MRSIPPAPLSRRHALTAGVALAATGVGGGAQAQAKPLTLLNVSYDPTRELYKAYNAAFIADQKKRMKQAVSVEMSHGGSAKQALSVIGGLAADVVTLGISADIDAISEKAGLLPANWQTRLPLASTPYTSTIVFLVRAGNPKKIKDWGDLIQPGVAVITPNPKTSSGARWNHMAAYSWALKQPGGTDATAQAYLAKLYANVPVLDTGARGATTTFAQRGIGDVLLAWENEAFLAIAEMGPDKLQIVNPSRSILAEPPVALVDKVAAQKGTTTVALAYLTGLYSPVGQEIIAKNGYRPRRAEVAARYTAKFPKIPLVTIAELGGWPKVQKAQFGDGGVFDRIYKPHG